MLIRFRTCLGALRLSRVRAMSYSNRLNVELPKPVKLSSLSIAGDAGLSPIIMCHGLFGSKNNWKGLSRQISEGTCRTVHALDLRNHGDSPHCADGSVQAMATDLRHFCEEIGHDRPIFVGHSMGGRVVFQFLYLFPEMVDRLVSVDVSSVAGVSLQTQSTFVLYCNAMQQALKLPQLTNSLPLYESRKIVDEYISPVVEDKFVRDFLLMNLVKKDDGQLVWKFNVDVIRSLLEQTGLNKLISKPNDQFDVSVFFIHGEKSNYLRTSDIPRIKEQFSNAKFEQIPGAGHFLHAQKPKEFISAIVPFLK